MMSIYLGMPKSVESRVLTLRIQESRKVPTDVSIIFGAKKAKLSSEVFSKYFPAVRAYKDARVSKTVLRINGYMDDSTYTVDVDNDKLSYTSRPSPVR